MPFQSEKQRRFLHANHPEIAKRWERDYASGGRIGYDEGGIGTWLKDKLKNIANVPGTNKSILDMMKTELDLYRMLWRLDFTDKEKKKLFKAYRDTNIQSTLLEKHAEMQKFNELYQHELANQPRDYANGGILDINESEEIISDDGNDIELTDYNAAFDDPNDLSTGVKTLFQAKDGGRIGFKRGTSGAPGGGDPGMSSGGGKSGDSGNKGSPHSGGGWSPGVSHSGAPDSHGQKAHGKGGRFDVANTKTTTTSSKGDDDGRSIHLKTKQKYPKKYKKSITHSPFVEGPIVTNIRDYYDPKGYTKRAPKTKEEKSLLDKIAWGIALYTGIAPLLGLKVPGIVATTGKVLGYRKEIDMALNLGKKFDLIGDHVTTDSLADSFVEKFKDRKSKMDEYKSLPAGHPDKIALGIELQIGKKPDNLGDDGGPQVPDVVPIHEEIEEYESIAPDAGGTLAAMRSKQALRAMLNPDWQSTAEEIEEKNNPLVMTANSGGLANLFRVKNQ